jgi:hypothetical protein
MVDSSALPLVSSLPAGLVPAPERLTLDAARALPVGTLVAYVEYAPTFLVGALDSVCESLRSGSEPWEISVSFCADAPYGDGGEGGDFWPIAKCAVLVPAS